MTTPDPTTTALDWLTEAVKDADQQPIVSFCGSDAQLTWTDSDGDVREVSCDHADPLTAARKVMEMYRLATRGPEVVDMIGHLVWLIETELKADGGHITAKAKRLLAHFPETPHA